MGEFVDDHYRVLGVTPEASVAQLRHAYRKLALRHHPDRAGEASKAIFQRIAAAYRILADPVTRSAYDRAQGRSTSPRRGAGENAHSGTRSGAPGSGFTDFAGATGRFSWRAHQGSGASRAGQILPRLSGPLEGLTAQGIVRQGGEGILDLFVSSDEAAQGGTAAIDMTVAVPCPTCLGHAAPRELWCTRCVYRGTITEAVTACVRMAAGTVDGTIVRIPLDDSGGAVLRVRVRVRRP